MSDIVSFFFCLVLSCLVLSCTGGRHLGVAIFSNTRLDLDLSRVIPSRLYISLSLSLFLSLLNRLPCGTPSQQEEGGERRRRKKSHVGGKVKREAAGSNASGKEESAADGSAGGSAAAGGGSAGTRKPKVSC